MAHTTKLAFLIAMLFSHSQAHMKLANPVPIGDINNSPVDNAARNPAATGGGAYPCKVASQADYSSAQITNMGLGSTFEVSFIGSAVHGGGSCQFSLSKDLAPDVQSTFKVIHSVEGGCPARNQPGNFEPGNADFADPSTYNVPIPQDLEAGRYTFAWTWVNKVGNREFYMNCAAVQIGDSGSSTDGNSTVSTRSTDTFFESLPDMVILNTAEDDCVGPTEAAGNSFKYADPGASLEVNEVIPDSEIIFPQCAAGGGKIDTIGAQPSGSGASSAIPASSAAASSDVPAASSTAASGFTTMFADPTSTDTTDTPMSTAFASDSDSTSTSTSDSFPASTGTATSDTPSSPSSTSSSSSNPGQFSSTQCIAPAIPCPNKGTGIICLSDTTFQNCASATACTIVETMAAGTQCVNGAVAFANLDVTVPVSGRLRRHVAGLRHGVRGGNGWSGWRHRH